MSFFHMPLQDWLRCNAMANVVIMLHQLPWHVYFPFTCSNLWLARNERIFKNQFRSQHSLIYSSAQAAMEFYFLLQDETKLDSHNYTMARVPKSLY